MVKNNNEKIEELIARTTDPVQQATLLVLSNIDRALESNTAATQAIADDFTEHRAEFRNHVADEKALMASVQGGVWTIKVVWSVALVIFMVIQAVIGFVAVRYLNQNDSQEVRLYELERRVTVIEQQHQRERGQ